MTPSERAAEALPPHLRRHVVAQEYEAYTPRDHAVWRYALRRLTRELRETAHPIYRAGLAATGIGTEAIPHLDEMNEKLGRFGWSAVCVRGFVPPAVFTEFQARQVLAIAADIRSFEHIDYTPAPDIIHESAGHAPILADTRFAEYVQRCGEAGFRAIASDDDQAVYEAIRDLSVIKEDPAATPAEQEAAEERVARALASRRYVSESARASRLYWWTAEYGLVGSLDEPKLYGAGLLSSIGESRECLSPEVRKLRLSPACVEVDFDITRMQPQLFVTPDFDELFAVLDAFVAALAWKRGGDYGLAEALRSRRVNQLSLPDGREVSGAVTELRFARAEIASGLTTALAVLSAPSLLSQRGRALSAPQPVPAVVAFGERALPLEGPFSLAFASGLVLEGRVGRGGRATGLRGKLGDRRLDLPGEALLAVAPSLPSVSAGPADPAAWDACFGVEERDAGEAAARARKARALSPELSALYAEARALREGGVSRERFQALSYAARALSSEWLLNAEVEELFGARPEMR